ncbi:CLUMA_CG011999, isoform A [Clunio marinus]|uniref:CLUMA_CG011999, isoform A n=1 Tax=Clunio marinus TaxID=568069 RepID=A0A1J1IKS4_9DIPT|nr:CLUMA_CG011999, isoform A [Clunio marinus]
MYRINVYYEINGVNMKKPVLLKLMPDEGIQSIVMEKNNLYPREIQVYSELLIECENLLLACNDPIQFAPKCLYTSFEPKSLLMFEDMRDKGYKGFPRNSQINFNQALPILIKLAKLHATTAVVYEKKPEIMKLYLEGSISTNPERQDFLIHYRNCASTLALVIENEWAPEWRNTAHKLKQLADVIVQKGCDLYLRDENAFNVFNHNDLWIPNLLFKFDDNNLIQDVLFVDFQLSYFGSPGIDLNFFFYGSLNEDTRKSFRHKLIRIYHETLAETLKKLNYMKPIPSLHDIQIEMLKTGMNGVLAALAEVPLLLMEDSENLDLKTLLADTPEAKTFRYNLFNNPKYRKFIQTLLLEFDDLGYLEC